MSILDRPQRPTVADAEWVISVQLVRGNTVLEEAPAPLRLSDSWFNNHFAEAGRNIGKFIDDQALRRSRTEAASKKAAKPRGRR